MRTPTLPLGPGSRQGQVLQARSASPSWRTMPGSCRPAATWLTGSLSPRWYARWHRIPPLSRSTPSQQGSLQAGPKRMIHIVQVSDILLTPADVPARTVQPAVTAEVLDDLGQWLADQGLDTGPVPPGERTTVLGQAVEYYYTRLTETVADLSPEGLMAFLVSHDEALVHDSQPEHSGSRRSSHVLAPPACALKTC